MPGDSRGEPKVVDHDRRGDPEGEAGLLGLAATAAESTVFAYYTAAEDNRIAAMSWDGAAG